MPRARRLHAPGAIFHVTARCQGRAPLFTGHVRDRIAEYICAAAASSTTSVLALTVMENHLHLIVRQGTQPLAWIIQRILQRTALLVKRLHSTDGHVFGRRYWIGICDDVRYARQAIVYTHLNPVYAGLCNDPSEYAWTSHNWYLGSATGVSMENVRATEGLRFFSSCEQDLDGMRADYLKFIRYWMTRPRLPLGAKYVFTDQEIALPPLAPAGDTYWEANYGDVVPAEFDIEPVADLRDRAMTALRALDKNVGLDQLRSAGRIRELCALRRKVVAMLLIGGCRNSAISRCLNVSPAYVSSVLAELRDVHQAG